MKRLFLAFAFLALISPAQALVFQADSQINVTSVIIPNNTNPIVIKAGTATVYSIEASNNSTTLAYIKLYNAASLAACGSGTPVERFMIPASASVTVSSNINGDAYVNGVVMCVTTGIADSDTGTPSATEYIVNIHWKQGQQ